MTYFRDGTVAGLISLGKSAGFLSIWGTSPIPYSWDSKLNKEALALFTQVASRQLTKPA
jgi:hypothetical protein